MVSLGTAASCATKASGLLFCWGSNVYGQLGDNSTTSRTTPTAVASSLAWTTVSVGEQAVCGVAGSLFNPLPVRALPPAPPLFESPNCWGSNGAGQFGNGTADGMLPAPTNSSTTVWSKVSLSDASACAIHSSVLALYCWGADLDGTGTLGDGSGSTHYVPLEVAGGGAWLSVFAGSGWGCGIRTNGSLSCWGYNRYGCVGDNSTSNRLEPVTVAGSGVWASLPSRGYSGWFTCGIQTDGSLWCWVRSCDCVSK